MLSQLFEQNKSLLEKRDSYLLPHLGKIICLLIKLEKKAGTDYFAAFKYRKMHKGEYLLKEGSICNHIWFLESGLARMFDQKDGVEVIQYFFSPAELIDAYASYIEQVPSTVNIQVIENAVVYTISRHVLKRLAMTYPIISEIENLAVQCHAIWLERRIYRFRHLSAMERYVYMLQHQAPLIKRISVNYIASYLGTSPETISRIRKKISENPDKPLPVCL
jgi:CRP-like cAMP-binding protein